MTKFSASIFLVLLWTAPAWCAGVGSEARTTPQLEASEPWKAYSAPVGYRPSPTYTSGDELWWDGFGLPSVNGQVICAADYHGSIVVGGHIGQAGGRLVNNIARWNGSRWEPLGDGLDGSVSALIVFEGYLVAGGWFQHAGGIPAAGIARWDGQTWSPMGEGLTEGSTQVTALAIHEGTLVAGGEFLASGSTPVKHIARWDGTSWTPIGEGLNFYVRALAAYSGDLYAGGEYTYSTSNNGFLEEGGGLARWNGTSWEAVGGGLQHATELPRVKSLSVHGDHLIVGGWFTHAGNLDALNIAGWDGASWFGLGSGIEWGVAETFSLPWGALYAGGAGLRFWDGVSWHTIPGIEGSVRAIRSFNLAVPAHDAPREGEAADLMVAGSFKVSGPGNTRAFHVARYTDGIWDDLEPWNDRMHGLALRGRTPFLSTLGTYQGRVVAAGQFDHAGNPPFWGETDRVAAWDGQAWTNLPPLPVDHGSITEFLEWNGTLYVAGNFPSGDPARPIIPVYRLSGNGWEALGASTVEPWAMAVYKGSLHVAGPGQYPYQRTGSLLRWDGSQWLVVGAAAGETGVFNPIITSMVELKGSLVIAGRFTSVSGVAATSVASWDGASWQSFGSGLPGTNESDRVEGLAVYQGALVATGSFTAPGIPRYSTVRWTGTGWASMGTMLAWEGLGKPVAVGSDLFLIGHLARPQEETRLGVVRWNGQEWVELGSGTNGPVYALIGHNGQVYMGGFFSWAGGKSSYGIARWGGPTHPAVAPNLAPATPNPFRASTTLTYGLSQSASVRVTVHDVMGREIAVIDESDRDAGTYSATWNGRDRNGNPAPAGVYFIRAAWPGNADVSRKVVRLR